MFLSQIHVYEIKSMFLALQEPPGKDRYMVLQKPVFFNAKEFVARFVPGERFLQGFSIGVRFVRHKPHKPNPKSTNFECSQIFFKIPEN